MAKRITSMGKANSNILEEVHPTMRQTSKKFHVPDEQNVVSATMAM